MSIEWMGWVETLGLALLNFVWQGALIGLGSALCLMLLRNAKPQSRYALSYGALLLCLTLPLWTLLQYGLQAQPTALATATQSAATAPVQTMTGNLPQAIQIGGAWQSIQSYLPYAVLLWACGAALLSLRMLAGLCWVRQLGQADAAQCDPRWQACLQQLAQQMGLRRLPQLRVLAGLESPLTLGSWRPLVLLPAALLTHMPPALIEALLAHELAHIRRYDYLANLLQSAIETLLFYHPVVWWLSRRIRAEREQIADDLAASLLGEPRRLALALSELAQLQSSAGQLTPPQLAQAANGGHLMTRIKRLVRPTQQPLSWKVVLPVIGLSALALAVHAANQSLAQPTSGKANNPAQQLPSPKSAKAHSPELSFALVRQGDGSTAFSGSEGDLKEVEQLRNKQTQDFLWFRQQGQPYLITDAETVARARALWQPVDQLGQQMETLGQQMEQHGQTMEALGAQMEAEHAVLADLPKQSEAERKLERSLVKQEQQLNRQIALLNKQLASNKNEAQGRQLEQQLAQLDGKLDALSTQLEQLHAPMEKAAEALDHSKIEEIGRKLEEAAKPMEALGKQMEALGKQQEAASKAAEQQLRQLLKEAQSKGLAIAS